MYTSHNSLLTHPIDEDDEIVPNPPGMVDTDPTTEAVLATSVANIPSTIPIKKSATSTLVKKVPEKQPQQPNHASNDDEIIPIPEGMFDTYPTTETVLETTAASAPSTSPIKNSKTKSIPHRTFNNKLFANDKDSTDDDEIAKIPTGMFDTDPFSVIVVVQLVTSITRDSPIKVKPTTKPIPTLVSNTYECLTNDNNNNNNDDDDAEYADCTVEIKQVPQTGTTVQAMNKKKMTSQGRDESDNRGDGNTDIRPVVGGTCELQNTKIKKKQPSTTAVVGLGTMITTNKGIPGVDNADDASAMTVATKYSCRGKYNQQIDIPEGFFDTDTTNEAEHPIKRKKYRKRKLYRHRNKDYGKQSANSTEGTGGQKRNLEGDQQEAQSTSSGNSGNGNNNNNYQNKETNKPSQFNDDRCPGKLGGDGEVVDVEQLTTFSVNLKFKEVPVTNVAKVLKAYSFECMTKVPGLTFHPTKDNTLPTPSPIGTKELFPTSNARFLEFFNTVMMQQEVTVCYKVKSPVPITQLRHRVFQFLRDKHVWMNSKQIHNN